MDTVTETCSSVTDVSLVGMNSSNRDSSSGEVSPQFSTSISIETDVENQCQFSNKTIKVLCAKV